MEAWIRPCVLVAISKWSSSVGSTTCFACPVITGVSCESGSVVPWVSQGYYRELSQPDVVSICIPSESCEETGYSSTICSEGYSGSRCSECSNEFFRSGGKCVKCLKKELRWATIGSSALAFLLIMAKVSANQQSIPPSLKLILFWFQFLSLLPVLAVSWPASLQTFLNFTSVFNLDIGYIGLGCDLSEDSYFRVLLAKLILPLLFSCFLLVQHFLMYLLKKTRTIHYLRILSHVLFITNFFSIQLFSSMFQIFNCVENGSGVKVISQQPSVQCFSTHWKDFAMVDVAFIVLYIGICPFVLIWMFKKYQRTQDQQIYNELLKPLLQSNWPGAEWFELVRLMFRFSFVLVRDVLPVSSMFKVSFLGILLMILIWQESKTRPYAESEQNDLSLL
jgi:hypothetical protein